MIVSTGAIIHPEMILLYDVKKSKRILVKKNSTRNVKDGWELEDFKGEKQLQNRNDKRLVDNRQK